MILHFVRIEVLEDKRQEVWQTIRSLAAEIKKEKDNIDSGFYQNAEDENDFLFWGKWTDRKALDTYLQSIQFSVLIGVRSLLRRPPEITIHKISHSTKLEVTHPRI
jgi:quinol monooxygenase YgiN